MCPSRREHPVSTWTPGLDVNTRSRREHPVSTWNTRWAIDTSLELGSRSNNDNSKWWLVGDINCLDMQWTLSNNTIGLVSNSCCVTYSDLCRDSREMLSGQDIAQCIADHAVNEYSWSTWHRLCIIKRKQPIKPSKSTHEVLYCVNCYMPIDQRRNS